MPIRTNRGRAAVYRKLWGWPMRSPKHLIISAVVGLMFVTAAGIVIPRLTGKHANQAAAATSTSRTLGKPSTPGAAPGVPTTPPTSTSLPTRLTSPPPPSSAPASPQALDTATRWAHAWVDHPDGIKVEQWLDRLRPYTTEEYLAGTLASIDPANVPGTEVTGPPVPRLSFERSVEAEVPTNEGVLRITVIRTDKGWRVSKHERGV
ncbi:MAG TPA: hypothetical protein VM677_11425 [Actinokineospora sp.]|nr:hypothetical protein [Actinokineospora sp.]